MRRSLAVAMISQCALGVCGRQVQAAVGVVEIILDGNACDDVLAFFSKSEENDEEVAR